MTPKTSDPPTQKPMDPTSRASRMLAWYRDHPGFHRCVTVADAIGETTHYVAVASLRLHERGDLDRHRLDLGTGGRPVTHYGVPAKSRRSNTK